MSKLLVIADDLTGATDIGVQFAKSGVATIITLDRQPDFIDLYENHELVVVDSETRHVEPALASTTLRFLAGGAIQSGVRSVYKKTDSTLRGNVGAELEAVLKASGHSRLCFVPALPQQGRTTCEGVQYVHGIPLHKSSFARDPLNPIRSSEVAEILATQTQISAHVVHLEDLSRTGAVEWPDGILIFDAETESDLRRIGHFLKQKKWLGAVAGPAGFGRVMPELLGLRTSEAAIPEIRRPVLIVNGSLNAVSLEQIRKASDLGFHEVRLSPKVLVAEDGPSVSDLERLADSVGAALDRDRDCLFCSVVDQEGLAAFDRAGSAAGLSSVECHERVAMNTGLVIGSLLQNIAVRSLVVFGGDTLMGIARGMGWSAFVPRAEILPGLAVVDVAAGGGPRIVTKPGGYGDKDLLVQLKVKFAD